MPLVHHELCFGCGRTNLFGLLLELEETGPGAVEGRCFIKQDHQGPDPGIAHPGIVGTALSEAMALACGPNTRVRSIEVEHVAAVPVGAFLEVEARVEDSDGELTAVAATATADRDQVARARGSFQECRST